MDARTLLDNFATIANAPDGVDRLRELVLDLAVHGRLVPQFATDVAASVELDALVRSPEWRLPARERGAKRDSRIEGLAGVAPIPEGWSECRLEEIVQLLNGRAYAKNELLDEGTPVIRIQNLNGGDAWYYSDLALPPDKMCAPGDLLFAWSASFGPYIWDGPHAIFHYHIWKIHLSPAIRKEYLYFVLQHLTAQVREQSHGLAMLHMTKARMERWPILLPPVAEQERIVKKVDELMQLCDDLEARQEVRHHITTRLRASSLDALTNAETDDALHTAWSRIHSNWEALTNHPDSVDAVRQAILHLAVRGRLVAQDPDDSDAHQLFRELVAERERLISEKAIRRRAALPLVQPDEQPFHVPSTWTWVRLDDIGDWGAGATPKRGESRYFGGRHNWFKSGELNDSPALSGPSDETVTDEALDECSLRLNSVGDVLVAMYGATIGRTAILATEATTNQAVCACTCFSGFDNEFLFLLLRGWRRELVQMGAGGAQPNISREKIVQTPIPLPPLAEQRRIVARAKELFRLCDELEVQLGSLESASIELARGFVAATTTCASAANSA